MDQQVTTNEPKAPPPDVKEKFQRRGFKPASEVKEEPVSDSDPEVETVETTEPEAKESLPAEFSFEAPEEKPEVEEPTVAENATVQPAEDDIVIGDKVFKDKKEAFRYAQELEREKLAADAFRQGLEAAQIQASSNLKAEPPKPPELETIPDEYYTNPQAYFAKMKREMEAKSAQTVDQRIAQINAHQATMQKFWTDYPDLARSNATMALAQKHIQLGLQKYGHIETNKALKLIAEETRAELKELGVTTLPTKIIPSNTKPAVSAGGSTAPTRPKPDEKPLNWVQQMKSIKNKRFAKRKG
jgi:hypothetical protein